jgi:hypothetical protein
MTRRTRGWSIAAADVAPAELHRAHGERVRGVRASSRHAGAPHCPPPRVAVRLGLAMSGHPTETTARALRAMHLLAHDLAEARRDAALLRRENAELRAQLELLSVPGDGDRDGRPVVRKA